MDDYTRIGRSFPALPLALSHFLYVVLFFFLARSVSVVSALAALFLVVATAMARGTLWGLLSGFLIGLSQVLTILLHQSGELPLASENLSLLILQPELIGPALMPVFGMITGVLAEHFGLRGTFFEKTVRNLKATNQALSSRLDHYERQFDDLSRDRVYKRSWEASLDGNQAAEQLVGLLVDTVKPVFKAAVPFDSPYTPATVPDSLLATRLFDLLRSARPETLAVFNLNGQLIQSNDALLALFGWSLPERAKLSHLTDLLLPDDGKRATAFLTKALQSGNRREEHLLMTSPDGGFSRLAIPPFINLECTGNPLAVVATVGRLMVKSNNSLNHDKDIQPPDVLDLIQQDFCCLSADGRMTYSCRRMAELLGETTEQLTGQMVAKFISHRSVAHFEAFLDACHQGGPQTVEIEMQAKKGLRAFFQFDAFPTIGAHGRYLGTTILIKDITSEKLVSEALSHRLSMEKLISSISTRFISVRSEDLDQEIEQVLKRIGDFEEAEESVVEIYPSKRIRNPVRYQVKNRRVSEKRLMSVGYGQVPESDRLETVTIPIVIESERLGCFRFYLEPYRMNWFETDLELIRLIGEIIINARIRMENELAIKLNENRLSTTLHSIGDAVIATDTKGRILTMNRQAEHLTGWAQSDALEKPLEQVFSPFPSPQLEQKDGPDVQSLHRFSETDLSQMLQSADGRRYFVSVKRNPVADQANKIYGEVIVFRDVTLEKQENDEIRYVSYHDKLTGLYNRAFFEEELTRLNTHRQYPITLILGDCNGLKIANDIFGHLEGDRLLQTIANILRNATRHEDIVARWGGDEFAIILPRTDEQAAAILRDRILRMCSEAESTPIKPSLALGSATNTDGSDDLIGLLKLAEDRMYRHKLTEGKSARSAILNSIEKMIYEKSCETEEHATRLSEISRQIGRSVGLSDYEMEELNLLSVLHDMGKIGIPDKILMKPDRLSDEEWEIMKKHSEKGYNLAKSTPELNSIADSILHHHERWDGTGYPAGLRGEQIPKLSRILSIVDAYDVITHSRTYKNAQSKEAALLEIERCAGSQFDPELSKVFVQIMKS